MKQPITISIVISAYNEGKNLPDCLASVQTLIKNNGEIIVIDNSSTDDTGSIAKKAGAAVYVRENNVMLNINKNFGFSKAQGKWIMSLDADERLTPALTAEIQHVVSEESAYAGYLVPRKNIIFNKWIQNDMWWPDYQLRLFKKDRGRFPEKHVHELVTVDGPVGKLKEPMVHLNYTTITQFIRKMDTIYTENEVKNFLASGRRVKSTDALRYPVDDFLKTFFLQKGYKDGLHGLVLSLLQAFYMFVVFAKIWEKQGFWEESGKDFTQSVIAEIDRSQKKTDYWINTYRIGTGSFLDSVTHRLKRKMTTRYLKDEE